MIIYYCIIFLISIFCLLEQNQCFRKYRQIVVILFITILGLFAGLRGWDPDYYNYQQAYVDAGRGYASVRDIGYTILCVVLNFISSNAVLMFVVIAFISVTLNINSFYKYTPYIGICVILYFVHNFALKEMIQIRAGLASALCLYSIRYIPSKQYRKAVLVWIIAISIQFSAIIYMVAFIVNHIRPSKRLLIVAIIVSIIIGTIYPLGQIIKGFTDIGEYSERVASYVMYGDSGYATVLGIWSNINTIKALVICVGLLWFYDTLASKYKMFTPLFLAYVFGTCWLICFNDFAIIGSRMSNILMCGEPVLLSYPCILMSKRTRIIYVLAIVSLAIIMLNFNIAPDKITPYKFCFQ